MYNNPRTGNEWVGNGYFASQARRMELYGSAGMYTLPLGSSTREAMEREDQKRKIREEILAKEGWRWALEEEVMREIQMERIAEARRLRMERWTALSGTRGVVMHGHRMPFLLECRVDAPLGRGWMRDAANVAFHENSPSALFQNKTGVDVGQPFLHHSMAGQRLLPCKSETPSTSNETESSESSGVKRKVHDEPRTMQKQWGCALCKVTSPNEEGLKEHVQGKKHKENTKLLLSCKKPILKKSDDSKSKVGASANGGTLKKIKISQGKNQRIWCSLCRVQCSSQVAMESHLSGKRHRKNNNVLKVKPGKDEEQP
ncbi:hypothetical protein HPP92_015328 [Vanilla planifolia]|uniref:U1-type domain-containing protein n=1 Tax=Vanilla planifolia TaxID=51239 RepID=A0A835UVL1_VANPL|nr:hypothetical protein HPP92_015328 [Vanilla planifolia]